MRRFRSAADDGDREEVTARRCTFKRMVTGLVRRWALEFAWTRCSGAAPDAKVV